MQRFFWIILLLLSPVFAQESYEQLLHHWDYDKSAPLNLKQLSEHKLEGVEVYDISYSAPVGDRAALIGPNGGLVPASLVVPPGQGPFPAVIYGHWCMPGSLQMNRTEFLDEALVLAHAGVISLLPDHVIVHPGFVEDKSPLNAQQITVEVQQDINLRRGADLLLQRKDVDPKRLAYVGHSCDATAGGYLSGIDKRFKAFVLMAGTLSDEADKKTKIYQDYRQKIGPEKFDAFAAKYSWSDAGKYVAHAAPATVFLQHASDEPFVTPDLAKQYFEVVSEPKKFKLYQAPHALNAEATRDRIAFLAEQLSFKAPDAKAVAGIPQLVQPPWPKPPQ
jgi:dienelactone hydrolase